MYIHLSFPFCFGMATSAIQRHPYHLVDPSPWPFLASLGALCATIGAVLSMHGFDGGFNLFLLGFGIVLYVMYVWWRDIIRESAFEGHHTMTVQAGLRWGMLLFIVSEIMFFFAFFWAFFHSSLAPTIELGAMWPPKGIEVLDPWQIPFLNTMILLTSGASVTWAHHALVHNDHENTQDGLTYTLALGAIFTLLQVLEYMEATFSMSDSVYGSVFFLATGFHGAHVCIGSLFLGVCMWRELQGQLTPRHHFGFEAAAWYWHFVDVVWLFLFVSIYWWGGA